MTDYSATLSSMIEAAAGLIGDGGGGDLDRNPEYTRGMAEVIMRSMGLSADSVDTIIARIKEAAVCDNVSQDKYMNEIVGRSAPRWAWDLIDETLDMDSRSTAFDSELRVHIRAALRAMQIACEEANDEPISVEDMK